MNCEILAVVSITCAICVLFSTFFLEGVMKVVVIYPTPKTLTTFFLLQRQHGAVFLMGEEGIWTWEDFCKGL